MMLVEETAWVTPPEALVYARSFLVTKDFSHSQACTFCRAFLLTIYKLN
jgi:hypothetical protein